MQKTRSFWGWGYEEDAVGEEQLGALRQLMAMRLGASAGDAISPPRVEDLALAAPRFSPPSSLEHLFAKGARARAAHTYGKAFRDVVRGLARDFGRAPDAVAFPTTEADLVDLFDLCTKERLAAIPYGGGTSVVGGVEARLPDGYRGALSIDLGRLNRLVEVDPVSRAARFQAGVLGPALEDALRPHGLTLRHYPQSFEFSSLGGWIATRAGGHFATLHTHIDDLVESIRMMTPAGAIETRRLPASGAGPSPDRLLIGSEGALGIITEAWVRLQERPRFRASATARFAGAAGTPDAMRGFRRGAEAARRVAQAGLYPANLRLVDADEALNTGAGDGSASLLLLGFESADHPPDAWMARAIEICRGAGGELEDGAGKTRDDGRSGKAGDEAGSWRSAFLQAPYLRDALARLGMIAETFETAIPWSRFEDFHAGVLERAREAAVRVAGAGLVTCRLTHVYPDGAAPYFTVIAPSRAGSQVAQWDEIKAAASEAILALGGTITHHHAVGRDHRPQYDREVPALFRSALGAAKAALDPAGIMNPGVLVD